MTGKTVITYGQIAYEAYCRASGGTSLVSGDKLPPWSILPPAIRDAWMAAGSAVDQNIRGEGTHVAPELAAAMAEARTYRERLAAVKEGLENLASAMDLSASTTAPSKKSEIERGCAQAVREVANRVIL